MLDGEFPDGDGAEDSFTAEVDAAYTDTIAP